jgi:hypothetical protein
VPLVYFFMWNPKGHQKSIFNTSKVKKNKDTYGIYPTKFASQKHKKLSKHQINQSKKKKLKYKYV